MNAPLEPMLAMRELRHRVDNMFQMVGGLIAREARQLDGPAAQALRKAEAQVQAFALLHRALGGDDVGLAGRPCAAAYLDELCAHLRRACLDPDGIVLETAFERPCPLDEGRCRALGLIATELVLNAAKHAFAGRPAGAVGVCLGRSVSPPRIVFGVMDDGCGMAEVAPRSGQGMGFVRILTERLGGECRIETGPAGTLVSVIAPVAG